MEMSPPKRCAVCGDKALGYNFNAVTCESCKAFFRRNALAKKTFTCPFSQNCEITVVTRRFCQRCRLKKCLDIGMKRENIMSEEDKIIKRRKIESNRAKRRLNEEGKALPATGGDINAFDTASHDSESSYDSGKGTTSNNSGTAALNSLSSPMCASVPVSSPILSDIDAETKPELMTSEEIVEFIVGDPDRASQAISKLMRTKDEALSIVEKILTSQKDALRLVSHLIAFPGDALKIISKIMNSPFDALTVFTKFMSSPTDALEIISKIVSSPQDVVQFIRSLMECPEDALDIMNKFMNTPAEALRIINKIFNKVNPPNDELHKLLTDSSKESKDSTFHAAQALPIVEAAEPGNYLLHSIVGKSPIMTHQITNELPPPNPQKEQEQIFANPDLMAGGHMNIPTTKGSTGTQTSGPSMVMPLVNEPSVPTSLASSAEAMSIASPKCVIATPQQAGVQHYNSPVSIHPDIELTSNLTVLMNPNSPANMESGASGYCNDNFDIKALIQQAFSDTAIGGERDSFNSLESVLSEVIRIEFEAFSNLPPEPRVKQEELQFQSNNLQMSDIVDQHKKGNHSVCNIQIQQAVSSPSSIIRERDLTETELLKLRELKLASEALYYPMDNDLSGLMMGDERIKSQGTNQDPKLLQVINLTAVAIKRLIKMAKKIGAFQDMCQEDQVALLKGGCTEMMIMRSVLSYDNNFNTWKLPHVSNSAHIRADILKQAKGNIYEEILKFVSNFDEKLRTDENIILIMCAIVLFTPTRDRVIHSDVIRLEQNSYLYLLRRYLESVYTGCEARSAFIGMIQKISEIGHLNQFVIGVYLNVNPSQVEPLLREMFDLKNH